MTPLDRDPRHLLDAKPAEPDDRAIADLLERLPPPGADDLSLERIWRGLRARTNRRPSRLPWVLVPVTVLAALCGVLLVRLRVPPTQPGQPLAVASTAQVPAEVARLELTAGAVLAARSRTDWSEAAAGATLPETSRLRTDAHGRALITAARSRVLIAAGTDVGLESLGTTTFLRLSGGGVVASVDPRRAGEVFTVQTTRYQVTVKGTIFEVVERSAEDVTVSVSRGLVEVSGNGGVWQVSAGHAWHSATPGRLAPDEITSRDRSLVEQDRTGEKVAPIRVEGAPGLEVSEDGVDLGPAPITWEAPVGRYHFTGSTAGTPVEGDAATQEGGAATVRLVRALPTAHEVPMAQPPIPAAAPPATKVPMATSEVEGRPTNPAAAPKPAHPKPALLARLDAPRSPAPAVAVGPPPTPSPSPAPVVLAADPYVEALALAHHGRYHDAAQALEAIAQRGLPHADLALYNLAELRHKQLHDPAGALEAYLRYERDFPTGSLVQEVELSAIELDLGRSAFPEALAQIDRFLAEHPDSERSPEVHQLRGNLLRERGDCGRAIQEYAAAHGDGLDDDSLYFTAWCQQKLGQGADAASSLREYLERFPHGLHMQEVKTALDR